MDLDIRRLSEYLEDAIAGFAGLRSATKFPGGQSNPTYRLVAQSGEYVLRRKPHGELLKSAHAVDREYRVLKALSGTDVPVGKVYHLCQDPAVIGADFYVMEFLRGDVFWHPTIPEIGDEDRARIYDELNRTLAAIHSVDLKAAGLEDYGRPGNYFERQIDRWSRQYYASETETIEPMNAIIAWLQANCVEDDGSSSLVHGDYRLDNVMFAADRSVLAVMDWELSTLGHALADLAYQCMQWRMPAGPDARGLGGVDREAIGIPGEADYVAAYCRRRNIGPIENWEFYLAFSFFRLAAILQGVVKRAHDGNASSKGALELRELIRPLAEKAMQVVNDGAG